MNIAQIREKYGDKFEEEVERHLQELAAENPDFVYNTSGKCAFCRYNGGALDDNGDLAGPAGPECSGCIFGQALQRMGWDDEEEMKKTDNAVVMFLGTINKSYNHKWVRVQWAQDSGVSWGEVVKLLDK